MKRIFIAALTAFLLSQGAAAAEPTETEQHIRENAQKHPQSSVVFMDVRVLQESKDQFCETSVIVEPDQGNATMFFTKKASGFFGRPDTGAIAFLPPGTYTIMSVQCKHTARLNGKFARFRVGPNEIINAGSLVIDFTKAP